MTGGSLVGLILLSMAWLFFALGAVTNFSLLYRVGWIILFVFFRGRRDGGAS